MYICKSSYWLFELFVRGVFIRWCHMDQIHLKFNRLKINRKSKNVIWYVRLYFYWYSWQNVCIKLVYRYKKLLYTRFYRISGVVFENLEFGKSGKLGIWRFRLIFWKCQRIWALHIPVSIKKRFYKFFKNTERCT